MCALTDLLLDHKTGVLSLVALHLAVATWSGACWTAKTCYGWPGGKVDWAHHVELHAASSCLVSHQCLSVVLHVPLVPQRTVVTFRSATIPMGRAIAATSLFQPVESRATCVIQWMPQRLVAVKNGGDFVLKSLSACRKPAGVESKKHRKSVVLTCNLPWLVIRRRIHATSQVCLVRPVWRCLEETSGSPAGRGRSLCLGVTVLVLGGQHDIGVGCVISATIVPAVSTCVARSVSSHLPRSPSLSADGSRLKPILQTSHLVQSVTAQERIRISVSMRHLQRG